MPTSWLRLDATIARSLPVAFQYPRPAARLDLFPLGYLASRSAKKYLSCSHPPPDSIQFNAYELSSDIAGSFILFISRQNKSLTWEIPRVALPEVDLGDDARGQWTREDLPSEVLDYELFVGRVEPESRGQLQDSIVVPQQTWTWLLHTQQQLQLQQTHTPSSLCASLLTLACK